MQHRFASSSSLLFLILLGACAPPVSEAPGMSPVSAGAAAAPSMRNGLVDEQSIVVVFPRSHRTGSTRLVFIDDDRNFYGAVGPGEAAVLRVPPPRRTLMLHAISSAEIHAQPGTWFVVNDVIVSAPSGLLLDGGGSRLLITLTSRSQIAQMLADPDQNLNQELQWLSIDRAGGQRWIDEHKTRVDELLARSTAVYALRFSAGVTRLWTP